MKFNKKAQETNFIVFIVVFFAVMGIIGSIFIKSLNGVLIKQELAKGEEAVKEGDEKSLLEKVSFIGSFMEKIPIVGQIWMLATGTITFFFIHNYLAMLLGAIVSVPIGYIILRLVRGGG